MNIKDFILSGDIPTKEQKAKQPRTYTKPEVNFTVEYENDTDFIFKRKTPKTERLLVVLVSQAQIYIKNVKDNTIENVTSAEQVVNFRKGMEDIPTFDKLIWKPFINNGSRWRPVYTTSSQFNNLIYHKETYKVLANKKLNPFKDSNLVYQYERDPEGFGKVNEVVKTMKLVDEDFSVNCYSYDNISRNIRLANLNYNTIKANLDIIKELGVNVFKTILQDYNFNTLIKDYLCDFKTLMKYFLYTIRYRNGLNIEAYGEFQVNQYIDYLRMQQEMYGKVKEKYPMYWLSEKQMMNNKYNKWREMQRIQGFDLGQERLKQFEFEDDVYKVIIPLKSTDILDEAQQQQHCVASYINRISRGETHIVFIRQKLNEEESCLTVEITPDNRIVQVRGFQNRDYTALEYSFMKKWAEEKNLKLEVREIVQPV